MLLAVGLGLGMVAAAGQQGSPAVVHCDRPANPAEVSFCARNRAYDANRPKLQAQAKQLIEAETSRDVNHDCPNAQTTYDFNVCFGNVLKTADGDLTTLEGIIRQLNDIPEPPGSPATNAPGPGGESLTTPQFLAEFEGVERSWRQYREVACKAALHQFGGGSGGPSAGMECEIRLIRDHMRELDSIYGMELHQ